MLRINDWVWNYKDATNILSSWTIKPVNKMVSTSVAMLNKSLNYQRVSVAIIKPPQLQGIISCIEVCVNFYLILFVLFFSLMPSDS